MTGPQGTSRYSYDSDGRLTSVTDPNVATVSYEYDEFGRKQRATSPSGSTDYGYDKLNRLTSVETRNISGVVLASYHYTLNSKGQRTHVEEGADGQILRTIEYEYDAADRLIEELISDPLLGNRTITYEYDPVGNRLTKTNNGVVTEYTYDNNDRLLTESGFSYTHDDNGNLLTKSGNGENWQLKYNALNQLTRANISTPQGASVSEYAYDHDGIRGGKTINGTDMIQYVVDKNFPYAQVLEEERTNGLLSASTSYVYGDALLSATTDGVTQYYHADGMGSVRGLSDMNGNITDSYVYDAYGMLLNQSGTTANPYLYRGEQFDSDLESYYLRARYYQPGTGRFLTTDPIEGFPNAPMSLPRYLYGNANPVNMIDPSGRMSLAEKLVTVGIIGNLAAMPIGAYTHVGQSAFSVLAKNVFPEAYIVGGNVLGTVPPPFSWMIDEVFKSCPVSMPIWAVVGNGVKGEGREVLLHIGSGEAALFKTSTLGGSLALPAASIGFELYDGFVFNLWNARDYRGPFSSFSLGVKNRGGALFWDTKRSFDGPWGGSSIFASKSWGLSSSLSFTKSNTLYEMVNNKPLELDRPAIVTSIYTILLATKLVEAATSANAMPLAFWLLEGTTWANIAIAHNAWNIREEKYSLENRREIVDREDVSGGYQSGPPFLSKPLP